MTRDRAAVVAAAVTAIVRRTALHGPELEREIAELLRQEFRDIEQQVLNEIRAEDPHG